MVIRVSGHPGAGKSTLCKRLAEALGYQYRYAGGIFREMAAKRNVSIESFYKALKNDPQIETSVDQKTAEIMSVEENLVIEGRMAPFLPCPFENIRILLTVDPREGARRATLRPENAGKSTEEMLRENTDRLALEKERFEKLYHITDHLDPKHYDVALDTTNLTPDQTLDAILKKIKPV
jgi:predicted cytidylate kinase